jgi:hypothetical protein
MELKPYNPNPSLPLIEAFQRVNIARRAVNQMYYLGSQLFNPSRPNQAHIVHFDVISNAHSTLRDMIARGLDALHRDDLDTLKSIASSAEASKEAAERAIRLMFEAWITDVWTSKEGAHSLRNDKGEILRYYGENGIPPYLYGVPKEGEDDSPF